MSQEKVAIAVEPSLRFQEREEEAARCAEQGQLMAFRAAGRPGGGVGEQGDGALEATVETCGERLAAEEVGEACVTEGVVPFGDRRE